MDETRMDQLWDEIWGLLEEGHSDAAAARALRALNEEGDEPELRYLLGVSLLDSDEPEAAIVELESATDAGPEWSEAQNALAWAYFRACRFEDAGDAAEATLELDPKSADAHQLCGLLAEREGNEVVARRELSLASRMDPDRYPKPVEM